MEFWSDKIADTIINRKKFRYSDREIPKMERYVVKTSASISGVLHIGRLSDTIRGESVAKSLIDMGVDGRLIWVAEDMDPLRKVPRGVPESYVEYIGFPVSDIPDPWGCHSSYAEHHVSDYFEVLPEFVSLDMERFSMRDEYRKGNFNEYIRVLMDRKEEVKAIQNKYRREPLPEWWSPWVPVCENCGKIITPRVIGITEDGKVRYRCEDYKFEKYTAKGCGYEGEADPMSGNGKLMWKSEWAAQWARWGVVSEGAGKEYQVPGSAFWINAEIAEKVLGFPSPESIFYEHLMIDGVKMSASIGNVVYPRDWLEVAEPEILRLLYNKKLMKTRSFSWKDLPRLYDEWDMLEEVYFGIREISNERDRRHMKRLFEISSIRIPGSYRRRISYEFAGLIGQFIDPEKAFDRAVELMVSAGQISSGDDLTGEERELISKRMKLASTWVRKYGPEEMRISLREDVDDSMRGAKWIRDLVSAIKASNTQKELYESIFEIARKHSIPAKELFRMIYRIVIGRDSGPKFAPFVFIVGKGRILGILEKYV